MKDLRGRKALVTGAASGIGRAVALELARAGVDLFLLDIDDQGLAEAVEQVQAAGVRAFPLRCDLSRPEEIQAATQTVLWQWGKLDILVNNAGVAFYGRTEMMTAEQWDWLLKVNLMGPVHLIRGLLPTFLQQEEGHIVNMCSIAGLVGSARLAAYHVSKFGLVGFSEALRAEFGPRGIGVSAICPGLVNTPMLARAALDRPDRKVKLPPKWLCASPESVARATVRAIRRNRGFVVVSAMGHAVWTVKRFFPGLLRLVSQLRRKKPHPETTHPVEPVAEPRQRAA